MHKKKNKSCMKRKINNDTLLKHIKLNLLTNYDERLTLNK